MRVRLAIISKNEANAANVEANSTLAILAEHDVINFGPTSRLRHFETKACVIRVVEMESENLRSFKNNSRSDEIRREANKHVAKKNAEGYLDALPGYNKCICFAELGSIQLAIGYANRSAAYFGLKMYKECLANIELTRSVGIYPACLESRLLAREAICHEELTAMVDIDSIAIKPELSYSAHEKVPFVANCVEIRRNVKYGRHLVANRDLMIGDVIAIENPFCTVNSTAYRYERCENCTREQHYNLIPCEGCTAAMFCSVECRAQAMRSFHKYECVCIDYIDSVHSTIDLTSIRLITTALASFNGDWKAMHKAAEQVDSKHGDITVFDIDYTQPLTAVNIFAPVYGMVNTIDEKCTSSPPMQAISTILYHAGLVSKMDAVDEPAICHLGKIVEHFWTPRSPFTDIRGVKDLKLHGNYNLVNLPYYSTHNLRYNHSSRGIYPFDGLFNHSCVPNVYAAATVRP